MTTNYIFLAGVVMTNAGQKNKTRDVMFNYIGRIVEIHNKQAQLNTKANDLMGKIRRVEL